jgi:hypothetical protein
MAKKEKVEFFRDDAPHATPKKNQILHKVVDTQVSHVQVPYLGKWYGF